jgi:hypothetical protein
MWSVGHICSLSAHTIPQFQRQQSSVHIVTNLTAHDLHAASYLQNCCTTGCAFSTLQLVSQSFARPVRAFAMSQ